MSQEGRDNRETRENRAGPASGTILSRVLAAQIEANRSALGHEASMAGHRERMTAEIVARAPAGGAGRLCLLGAGNANDVDLDQLADAYREINLVDLDAVAVEGAREGVPEGRRARIVVHAPVDLSGMFERFEPWLQRESLPDLAAEVKAAAERVVGRLRGPFDTVVSCCMLTQLQLTLLELMGDRHPAFEALRGALNAVHVRTLTSLVAPGGVGLLATDLTSSATYPFDTLPPDADLRRLFDDLIHAGNIIYVAHPGLLSSEIRRDPELRAQFTVRFPIGPWLWHNGPELTYLVYALEIRRATESPSPCPLPAERGEG